MNNLQALAIIAALIFNLSYPTQKNYAKVTVLVSVSEYAEAYINCPTVGILVTSGKIRLKKTTDKAISQIYIKTNYNMALCFPDSFQMVHLLDIHKRQPVTVQLRYKINGVDLVQHSPGNPGSYTFPVQPPGLSDRSWLTIDMSRDWQQTDEIGLYWGNIVFTFAPT